jgi:hypothetical protein
MHTGKTTISDLLVERGNYVRASFAEPMKALVAALGLKPSRKVYQTMGHEGRKIIGETVWVQSFYHRYGDIPRLVVDDMRYENEYQFLMGNNARFVRLECDEPTRWERYKSSDKYVKGLTRKAWASRLDHPTETQMDDPKFHWDCVIDTSRLSVEQVFEQVLAHNPGILE